MLNIFHQISKLISFSCEIFRTKSVTEETWFYIHLPTTGQWWCNSIPFEMCDEKSCIKLCKLVFRCGSRLIHTTIDLKKDMYRKWMEEAETESRELVGRWKHQLREHFFHEDRTKLASHVNIFLIYLVFYLHYLILSFFLVFSFSSLNFKYGKYFWKTAVNLSSVIEGQLARLVSYKKCIALPNINVGYCWTYLLLCYGYAHTLTHTKSVINM